MIPLEVRPEAQAELHEALAWYEEKQAGLGHQFPFVVDAAMARIRRHPMSFRTVDGDVRQALLRRFPYALLFEAEETRITVIAVYHGRRKPRGWSERVSDAVGSAYVGAHNKPQQPTGSAGG